MNNVIECRCHGLDPKTVFETVFYLNWAVVTSGLFGDYFPKDESVIGRNPSIAYNRISKAPIDSPQYFSPTSRFPVYRPDIQTVLDYPLIKNVDFLDDLNSDAKLIVLAPMRPNELYEELVKSYIGKLNLKKLEICTFDPSKIVKDTGMSTGIVTLLPFAKALNGHHDSEILKIPYSIESIVKQKYPEKTEDHMLAIEKALSEVQLFSPEGND